MLPATLWGTAHHVAGRLLVLSIKWSVVCWCSEDARLGRTGLGSLPEPVLGLMQRAGMRGTRSTVPNPGPSEIYWTVCNQTIILFKYCFSDYSDITSDESRTKDINGYWEKEVGELLGDLMPPLDVRN